MDDFYNGGEDPLFGISNEFTAAFARPSSSLHPLASSIGSRDASLSMRDSFKNGASSYGGYTASAPAKVQGGNNSLSMVEIHYKRGKKVLKRVKLSKDESKLVKKDEAMESLKKMFKYLKQQNRKKDEAWEARELAVNGFPDEE